MNDWRDEFAERMRTASRMKDYALQVPLLEHAIRLADTHGDDDAAFEARVEYVNTAIFAGLPERAMVAFTWCAAKCEQNPERFSDEDIAWSNKNLLLNLVDFPQIQRTQLEAAMDDMEARYTRLGSSMRPVQMIRARMAREFGDARQASYETAWWDAPRDEWTHCDACELDIKIDGILDRGGHRDALDAAAPLVDGALRCYEVPTVTFAALLRSCRLLDEHRLATELFRRSVDKIHGQLHMLGSAGRLIEHAALTGKTPRAQALLEDALRLLPQTNPAARFRVLLGAKTYVRALASAHTPTLTLALPPTSGLGDGVSAHTHDVQSVHQWLCRETEEIAARFDARNGTKRYAQAITDADAETLVP